MNTRQLKVSSQPKPRKGYVPQLRLAGEWLRRAGIEIGQKVEVRVYDERIEIIGIKNSY
jgi:hypothetical protein